MNTDAPVWGGNHHEAAVDRRRLEVPMSVALATLCTVLALNALGWPSRAAEPRRAAAATDAGLCFYSYVEE